MSDIAPDLPDIILWAIPAFIILIVAELLLNKRGKGYELRDTVTSLAMGLGSRVAGFLTLGPILAIAYAAHDLALFDIGYVWWAWPICFVLDDLAYYLFHRSAHRVRWFWASHVNHHSSEHYNLSTALRQTWTGFIAFGFIFRLPILLIGFPVEMVLFCGAINLLYQYWFHTEAIDKMPRWFEYLFNTPSHHRVHHAVNPAYLDANYAGVLMIWDRMFGSFVAEDPADPPRYGLVANLGTFNLVKVAFHEWTAIARDVWSAPWRHKLSYMIREPGWSHDGSRETSAMIRARANSEKSSPTG
ncbi:sterol desaturase family protein [Sphingorhabdus arenilitoris]|uniref:Sterol desaturase family protein n=1 Tax=Sphingorhabdus arenilitoris TaxID=1490041 RepID=A0ABV8RLC5_9SPHN